MSRKRAVVRQLVLRIHEGLADRLLEGEGGDGDRLGQQPGDVQLDVVLALGQRVERGQRRHHRRQDRHRVGGRRIALEELLHVFVEHAVVGQPVVELGELVGGRQLAVEQQVADLGKGRMLGDLLDRVTAVAQDALFAVDEGDRALAAAGVAVAVVERDRGRLRAQAGNVDADLVLRSHRRSGTRIRCLLRAAWRCPSSISWMRRTVRLLTGLLTARSARVLRPWCAP